jgi:hypothetical protein
MIHNNYIRGDRHLICHLKYMGWGGGADSENWLPEGNKDGYIVGKTNSKDVGDKFGSQNCGVQGHAGKTSNLRELEVELLAYQTLPKNSMMTASM